MIALDLDGTLLDYSPAGGDIRVNHAVMRDLATRRVPAVAICTNQGGLPFGVLGKLRKDGQPYPTPAQFVARLSVIRLAMEDYGIVSPQVRVSLYHPYADPAAIDAAARQVRSGLDVMAGLNWTVYTTAAARKPGTLMLRSVCATEYWGDSDEDAQAAQAAGIPFVRVPRFG